MIDGVALIGSAPERCSGRPFKEASVSDFSLATSPDMLRTYQRILLMLLEAYALPRLVQGAAMAGIVMALELAAMPPVCHPRA